MPWPWSMRITLPYPSITPAKNTVPDAAAWMGVPSGTPMSMPLWNVPHRSPKGEVTGPTTGHESCGAPGGLVVGGEVVGGGGEVVGGGLVVGVPGLAVVVGPAVVVGALVMGVVVAGTVIAGPPVPSSA